MKKTWKFLFYLTLIILFFVLIEIAIDINIFPSGSDIFVFTAFLIFLIIRFLIFLFILYAFYKSYFRAQNE